MWDLQTLNRLNAEAVQRTRDMQTKRIAWENVLNETPIQNPDPEPRYPEGDITEWRSDQIQILVDRTIEDLERQCNIP